MKGHRPEVADVFRTYEKEFFAQWGHVLSPRQRKAFAAIRDCRTAALGGHVEYVEQCDTCGHRVISYNSCRDRHCPKCQASLRAKWLAVREAELLPVPYFHVVFTLPQQIGMLSLQNAREIYNILFRAASETLLTIAADPKRLGADFWPSYIPGDRTFTCIRICTVWFPAVASVRTAQSGLDAGRNHSFSR
jgi:hypothetical protein